MRDASLTRPCTVPSYVKSPNALESSGEPKPYTVSCRLHVGLTAEEAGKRRSQIVTASFRNVRYRPLAFTEQGVAMLSSVLRSRRAVEVNVEIIRAFVRLREMLGAHVELARQLEQLEKKYDAQFRVVFDAIRELMSSGDPPKRPIGFHPPG